MIFLARLKPALFAVVLVLIPACASVQRISPDSVEDKVGRIKLGVTTMVEVETIFGAQHGNEDRRWSYNISDTAMEIAEQKTGMLSRVFPVAPRTVATNTRALIALRFTEGGKVAALEFSRFFDPPFINDYWYKIKDGAQQVLEFIVKTGEANGLRVAESDPAAVTLALNDSTSTARFLVKLANQTLHISSNNPHDRLTTEYRVFTKRERAFINQISTADFLW
jgi:hypothetical protein